MIKDYTLSIDPSIDNLGWALFYKKKLTKWGLCKSDHRTDKFLIKAKSMIVQLQDIVTSNIKLPTINSNNYFDYVQIVTEIPDHFGAAGVMSRESGAIYKLTFLAGMIYNLAPDVKAYLPREWKGQMNKHNTCLRLSLYSERYKKLLIDDTKISYCKECDVEHAKILGNLRHDTVDAVGIGHKWLFGRI